VAKHGGESWDEGGNKQTTFRNMIVEIFARITHLRTLRNQSYSYPLLPLAFIPPPPKKQTRICIICTSGPSECGGEVVPNSPIGPIATCATVRHRLNLSIVGSDIGSRFSEQFMDCILDRVGSDDCDLQLLSSKILRINCLEMKISTSPKRLGSNVRMVAMVGEKCYR